MKLLQIVLESETDLTARQWPDDILGSFTMGVHQQEKIANRKNRCFHTTSKIKNMCEQSRVGFAASRYLYITRGVDDSKQMTTFFSRGTGEALDPYLKSKLLLQKDRRMDFRASSEYASNSSSRRSVRLGWPGIWYGRSSMPCKTIVVSTKTLRAKRSYDLGMVHSCTKVN